MGFHRKKGLLLYDLDGNTVTLDDIRRLPKTLSVGSCAGSLNGIVNKSIPGCMPYPNAAHTALHQLTGTFCRILTPKNRYFLPLLAESLKTCERRKALIWRGKRIDLPLQHDDSISPLPALSLLDQKRD